MTPPRGRSRWPAWSRRSAVATALLFLMPLSFACAPGSEDPEVSETGSEPDASLATPEDHQGTIESWQAERSESLQAEDGWLSLVGLHWLENGESRFGSAAENDLVFPEGAPANIGTVRLAGGRVTLRAAEGSGLTLADGAPVEPGEPLDLVADTTGEPTVLSLASLSFYVIERGGRYGLRLKDPEGPARRSFVGLEYYPIDPSWRVEARLERAEDATISIPNVLGQVEALRAPGVLVFRAPTGEELRVTPTQAEEGDALFLVFGDGTNGQGTYGGGRFLYADPPAEGGDRVVLDFNRAYNPPCAFTPYATCPLPPPENKLAVAIEAGEKSYAGEIPH